jgi:hypothetical protein
MPRVPYRNKRELKLVVINKQFEREFRKYKGEVVCSGMAFVPNSVKIRLYEVARERPFLSAL